MAWNNSRQLRTTVDKREIKDFSKLSSATSFIRKTLCTYTNGYRKVQFIFLVVEPSRIYFTIILNPFLDITYHR